MFPNNTENPLSYLKSHVFIYVYCISKVGASIKGSENAFDYKTKCTYELYSYIFILAASPLASSGIAAIGDWKGLGPFQTSIF